MTRRGRCLRLNRAATTMSTAATSTRRSSGRSASSLRSVRIPHLDQPLAGEPAEEVEQIRFEPLGGDVVFGEEGVAQGDDSRGLLEQRPDAGANAVEGVVEAGVELEDRGFAGEVARYLACSHDDHRVQGNRAHKRGAARPLLPQ